MVNNGERLEKWVIVSCCFIIFFEMDRNHRMKRHCCRTCSTCNSFATLPSRNLNSTNLWVDFRDMIPQNVRPQKIWIEWYLETFWDVQMGIWEKPWVSPSCIQNLSSPNFSNFVWHLKTKTSVMAQWPPGVTHMGRYPRSGSEKITVKYRKDWIMWPYLFSMLWLWKTSHACVLQ